MSVKHAGVLKPYFYEIPLVKMLLLGISTVGVYLPLWYYLQFSQSNSAKRAFYKDVLKAFLFPLSSFSLFLTMQKYLSLHQLDFKGWGKKGYILAWLLPLVLLGLSLKLAFIALLVGQAIYATYLQHVINQHHTQAIHTVAHPWAKMGLIHYAVVFVVLVTVIFFQSPLYEAYAPLFKNVSA